MQYFIYHKTGERRLVRDAEYEELLKTNDWFKSPSEAEAAKNADIFGIEQEEKAKLEVIPKVDTEVGISEKIEKKVSEKPKKAK